MVRRNKTLFAVCLLALASAGYGLVHAQDEVDVLILPLEGNRIAATTIKQAPQAAWWVQFADALIIGGDAKRLLQTQHAEFAQHFPAIDTRYLAFHGRGCDHDLSAFPERVLYDGGRWSLVLMPVPVTARNADSSLRPFEANVVVTREGSQNKGTQPPDPDIQGIVDLVDPDRWFADVVTLASYDRHSVSPELIDARDWLVAQFSGMPGITSVETEEFLVQGQSTWNVIATLPGATRPDDWVVIGAHYDSRRQGITNTSPTPGAEDNASGCAGVLEAARIITSRTPEQTIKLMCYSGEEEGLIGSTFNASQLMGAGDLDKIELMLNMDMIGFSTDADLDVLLETETPNEAWLTVFADAAATYTNLRSVSTIFACCSDHVPYLNRGVPAILTIENDWNVYPHYHQATDLPVNMTRALEMGGGILRMNMAVLAEMTGIAQAASDFMFADGLEQPVP